MSHYTQLTQEERYQIDALLKMDHTQTEIAKVISVNKSTISRELCRNRGHRGYRPKQAHDKALARRDKPQTRISPSTWSLIEELIHQDWSPEQISGRLKKDQIAQASHEWIYQHILRDKQAGGDLSIAICAVRRPVESAMAATIAVESCLETQMS